MFGYVVLNKPEIKFKDFDLYRSFYCGLCRELKEKYGISGQISLTYDMTFVVILLSALYEPPTKKGTTRCIIHPVQKQPVRKNAATEYGADMNVLLTYYKCRDDWDDEKKISALGYSKILQGKNKKLSEYYPEKAEKIQRLLRELAEMEKAGEKDIDRMSGCFGRIMEEILAWKSDVWETTLRKMGFYLGIGGVVTFKNAKKLKEVVQEIPLEALVLETDSPYLAPVPHRGKRNNSQNLVYVAEEIAALKGVSYEEVVRQTTENAKKLYRLEK